MKKIYYNKKTGKEEKMSKLRVGVIRGGVSTEREVSLKTGSEIVANLNRDKYEVFDIVIESGFCLYSFTRCIWRRWENTGNFAKSRSGL